MDENAYIVKTYQENVKQNDLVVFDVSKHSNIIKAIEFVGKHRDKLGAVIIGWDSGGMNNFDNKDLTTYPEIMKNYEYFFSTCKAIRPNLPIGVIVCMCPTHKAWLEVCPFQYNFIALWNVTKFTANFEKIKNLYFPSQELLICGMNAGANQEFGGEEYQNYIKKIKQLGYVGSIWIK